MSTPPPLSGAWFHSWLSSENRQVCEHSRSNKNSGWVSALSPEDITEVTPVPDAALSFPFCLLQLLISKRFRRSLFQPCGVTNYLLVLGGIRQSVLGR